MKAPADPPKDPQCSDSVLASLPDTVLRCTSEGVVTALHRGPVDIGTADRDAVGQSIRALFPAPAADILLSAVNQTVTEAGSQAAVYALSGQGESPAERRYFEVRTVLERDGHVVCVIRDVTDRRIAEQSLIRRDLYLGALTQMYHRLLASDAYDDSVTDDSLAMLGYAAGASLAYYVDLRKTSPGADLPLNGLVWRTDPLSVQQEAIELGAVLRRRPFAQWFQMLKGGRPVQAAVVDKGAGDDAAVPLMSLVLPIIAQGRLTGLLGLESSARIQSWTDDEVDYLRAAVAAIALHMERAQVTAQLEASAEEIVQMSVQLGDARDQARASDRAKSEFLAVMGHEIRTPLNPVIAMTEMLLETGLTPEQRDYAELAHEAAILLLDQINAILDYVEVESGNLTLERLVFDPVAIVEKTTDLYKTQAREQQLSLMTFCHRDLPPQLLGDPARLSAVLENLLDNALKFTKEGEIIVRVEPVPSGAATDTESIQLMFSVSDTGIGLPAGAADWLFRPFTQADSTSTRQYGGTGLGLSTAKRWVEAMGGEIGTRANPIGGTVFWYSVPFRVASDTAVRLRTDGFVREQTLEGLRVLIVDDLAGNRAILKNYLELWHATCTAVADGTEALAALSRAQRPYHIALVDLMLPGMDGVALAGAIRQQARSRDMRLVLVTGYDAPGQEQRIRSLGFSGYLTKPFHRDELYNTLVYAMATADNSTGLPDGVAPRQAAPVATRMSKDPAIAVEEADFCDLPAILLIEHNTILRRVAVQDIAHSGCDVVSAATEAEALRILSSRNIDLVLVDLPGDVPRLAESASVLRAASAGAGEGRRRQAVLIGMTAQPGQSISRRCVEAGLDGCIAKPLTSAAVRQLLSQWCADRYSSLL